MTLDLSKERINTIKISNAYTISLLGMKFDTALQILMYGIGISFSLPSLIKYLYPSKQEYEAFYEQLPFVISEQLRSMPISSGLMMIGFTFIFFKVLPNIPPFNSFKKYPDGVITSKRIVKKIIYKGKRIKAKIIDKDISEHHIQIKAKSTPSLTYEFSATEFESAYFATLNTKLSLQEDLYVYWHPKYPELAIPSYLVGN